MGIDRSNVVRGPGTVDMNGVQIFDNDVINLDWGLETMKVRTSVHGDVDTWKTDVTSRLTFTPCGRLTSNILGKMYPHGTPNIGASIFGASDVPTTVHSTAGKKKLIHATALIGMPSLKLSSKATAFASNAEVMGLIRNTMDPTDANSMFTSSEEEWSGSFDTDDIKGGLYIGTWTDGVSPLTIYTEDGWDVEFEMNITYFYADGIGTYDAQLDGVTVRAKCTPVNLSESEVEDNMKIQGDGAGLGKSMRPGKTLTVEATGALSVVLQEAALMEGPRRWGSGVLRNGQIGFEAHRKLTGGVPAELFSVGLAA